MRPAYKNVALILFLVISAIIMFNLVYQNTQRSEAISFAQFKEKVKAGVVKDVTIKGRLISGTFTAPQENNLTKFETVGYESDQLYDVLQENKVDYTIVPESNGLVWGIMMNWIPMILMIGLFVFLMRQIQAGGGKAMSFGKARAQLVSEKTNKITFKDVAGIDEAKEELSEIIDFLKDPKRFTRLGGRIPKGVLLMGAPGTGKTLLARAIAGEAGVPFFSISGSDFVEMFVGVGASRVRDLFIQGKKNAPCIIFIDEIDAVGRHRGAGLGGGHDEREQTLNQLLVEMDGFESNEGVILIAATNRPDVLDPALQRPGRFDRRVVVPVPDFKGRFGILKVHSKKVPLDEKVDLAVIARGTPGFTGADLSNLVNESALLAARRNKPKVTMEELEQAKDKVMMGTERRSMLISDEEKRMIAYHESGHALVGMKVPHIDPVHKVTIIPRGMSLGLTQVLPEDDRFITSREYLISNLAFAMGGRAAEEIALGTMTTGAANDLERATQLARRMVCEFGMSTKMGPQTFGHREEMVFLGRDISHHKDFSEQTAREIDEEVQSIMREAYRHARQILTENRSVLDAIADSLLKFETIDSEELKGLLEGREIVRQPVTPPEVPAEPPAEAEVPKAAPLTPEEVAAHYQRNEKTPAGEDPETGL
ncbi:MAG: ATP-dependent metallopeptidase FtsH/Yme1/Tma family protein [Myxococcales bacterium]|nr:ATP-dependent metallopeptidase FtsH/Yme1/Tma family protein [Myxococcales bacterium]